jgi:hypothetical protein
LREVLAECRRWLVRKRIVKKGGGCGEVELTAAEKRMGRRLPADVRAFLEEVRPIPMFKDGELNEDGPSEFFFYEPEQPEMRWRSLAEWGPSADWRGAEGLAIGQTGYGDALFWVRGHRVHPDGCVAVDDHEVAMGDLRYAVLARSLSELIAKVVHLKGLSPGLLDDDFDDVEDEDGEDFAGDELEEEDGGDTFGLAEQELFDREYGELNPTSKKGRTGRK